jgi:hypothetical protein
MKTKVKCKTSHGKNEKKCEFDSPWNECLGFKCGTPIMIEPLKLLRTLFPSKLHGILREGGYGCHLWYSPRVDH